MRHNMSEIKWLCDHMHTHDIYTDMLEQDKTYIIKDMKSVIGDKYTFSPWHMGVDNSAVFYPINNKISLEDAMNDYELARSRKIYVGPGRRPFVIPEWRRKIMHIIKYVPNNVRKHVQILAENKKHHLSETREALRYLYEDCRWNMEGLDVMYHRMLMRPIMKYEPIMTDENNNDWIYVPQVTYSMDTELTMRIAIKIADYIADHRDRGLELLRWVRCTRHTVALLTLIAIQLKKYGVYDNIALDHAINDCEDELGMNDQLLAAISAYIVHMS